MCMADLDFTKVRKRTPGNPGRPKGSRNKDRISCIARGEIVSATITKALGEMGYPSEDLTLEQRRNLAADVVLSVFRDEEWRKEFAVACLLDPMGAAKLGVSLIPKNVKVEAAIAHQHVIVVPERVNPEVWNNAHAQRKELSDGDWGTQLSDTAFAHQVMDAEMEEA